MNYNKWNNIVDNYIKQSEQRKYKKLNELLELFIRFNIEDMNDLEELVPLATIILENTSIISRKKYNSQIDLNTSIKYIIDFLNSINPEYAYIFQNILREPLLVLGKERPNVISLRNYTVKMCGFYYVIFCSSVNYSILKLINYY